MVMNYRIPRENRQAEYALASEIRAFGQPWARFPKLVADGSQFLLVTTKSETKMTITLDGNPN